jgi:site-specific DNA-cytosine methylase
MPKVWKHVFAELQHLGFRIRWATVEASHVGLPMRRARWFCLAMHESARHARDVNLQFLMKVLIPPSAKAYRDCAVRAKAGV